ncbi:MAG: head GIN domain-containing protein [Bacteroidota bacterium]
MTQQELDRLFDAARNVPVETPVQHVTEWVNAAAAASVAGIDSWIGKNIGLTKKTGNMIGGSLAGLGAIGILAYSLITGSGTQMGSSEKRKEALPLPGPDKGHIVLETVQPGPYEVLSPQPRIAGELNSDGSPGSSPVELKANGLTDPRKEDDDADAHADKIIAGIVTRGFIGSIPDSGDHNGQFNDPLFSGKPIGPIQRPQLVSGKPIGPQKGQQLFSIDKDLVRETRVVSDFNKIELKGVMDLTIKQGKQREVVVEATAEQQKRTEISNEGEKLVLDTEKNKKKGVSRKEQKVNVFVTVTDLNEISHLGVGDIRTDGILEQDNIKIKISGVGDVNLNLVCDELQLSFSGVGDTKLEGKAGSAKLNYSGVGDLEALTFPVKKLEVTASGVGDANIHATEELSIDFSGVGSIRYAGDPAVRKLESSGVGKIKKN